MFEQKLNKKLQRSEAQQDKFGDLNLAFCFYMN